MEKVWVQTFIIGLLGKSILWIAAICFGTLLYLCFLFLSFWLLYIYLLVIMARLPLPKLLQNYTKICSHYVFRSWTLAYFCCLMLFMHLFEGAWYSMWIYHLSFAANSCSFFALCSFMFLTLPTMWNCFVFLVNSFFWHSVIITLLLNDIFVHVEVNSCSNVFFRGTLLGMILSVDCNIRYQL